MRRQRRPPEVETDVVAQLLDVGRASQAALAYVDSLGVIEHLRFADVARRAAQWAAVVRERSVQPEDRVIVLAGRDREWRSALLGVLQAGAVAVPCPAQTPGAEIRAIALDADAVLFLSAEPRPDVVRLVGTPVLTPDALDTRDAAQAKPERPYKTRANDAALILYTHDGAGLRGVVHTRASLLAQADAGQHWLGVTEDERVWCTATDGSVESIEVLLAAWRMGAEIVVVDLALDSESQFELIHRFRPAAVWFSNSEYGALASAAVPEWVELGSIRRALVNGEPRDGAHAFQEAHGAAAVAVVWESSETGERDGRAEHKDSAEEEQRRVDDQLRREAKEARRLEEQRSREEAKKRELNEQAEREAAHAEERRKAEEQNRLAKEAKQHEEQRRREAKKARRLQEQRQREETKQRELNERAGREAARAEERRQAEEQKRRAKEEKQREEERRREAEQARRLEDQRSREEAKQRELAERAASKERRRLEQDERAKREAARSEEQRRAKQELQREEERRHETAEQAERERLAPDTLSRISQYGMTAADPDKRREPEEPSEPSAATAPDVRSPAERPPRRSPP